MSKPRFQRGSFLPHILAIGIAAFGCLGAAIFAKNTVEAKTSTNLGLSLSQNGFDWADVTVDGLSVTMSGVAPDEATRFAALSTAGKIVDASRIIDDMGVQATEALAAPNFAIEILKNDDGLSLIGLVPLESDPETILERARRIGGTAQITDLLESADFAPPAGWERALSFGLNALDELPRAKVSVTAERVAITAAAADLEDKRRIERQLNNDAPSGVALALNISSPRPVIAPFTLRLVMDENSTRFDACSADTESARDAIIAAAIEAGLEGDPGCVIGLGTPSTRWGEASVAAIQTLARLGGGTLTLSNADVTIIARRGVAQSQFDNEIGTLESTLPEAFSVNAILPEDEDKEDDGPTGTPEFVATRSPEGLVQLRGRLGDDMTRSAVESFAAAHFGANQLYPATRIDTSLPAGWPTRVLTSLEALAILNNGVAQVTPDTLEITGVSGRPDARAEITRILTTKLKDGAKFSLDVTYSEELDPLAALPTPEECVDAINAAANERKITFAPSSTDIEAEGIKTIDKIAELLRDCQTVQIEIGGHTDSQGRESMNQQLSQSRADAVLNAIMSRRVLTSNLSAKGYGESRPIASNETEEGREANRRIEFRLVLPEEQSEGEENAETGETDE